MVLSSTTTILVTKYSVPKTKLLFVHPLKAGPGKFRLRSLVNSATRLGGRWVSVLVAVARCTDCFSHSLWTTWALLKRWNMGCSVGASAACLASFHFIALMKHIDSRTEHWNTHCIVEKPIDCKSKMLLYIVDPCIQLWNSVVRLLQTETTWLDFCCDFK